MEKAPKNSLLKLQHYKNDFFTDIQGIMEKLKHKSSQINVFQSLFLLDTDYLNYFNSIRGHFELNCFLIL